MAGWVFAQGRCAQLHSDLHFYATGRHAFDSDKLPVGQASCVYDMRIYLAEKYGQLTRETEYDFNTALHTPIWMESSQSIGLAAVSRHDGTHPGLYLGRNMYPRDCNHGCRHLHESSYGARVEKSSSSDTLEPIESAPAGLSFNKLV